MDGFKRMFGVEEEEDPSLLGQINAATKMSLHNVNVSIIYSSRFTTHYTQYNDTQYIILLVVSCIDLSFICLFLS